MSNPSTKFLKITYTALIELDEPVNGIADDNLLLESTKVLDEGLKAVGFKGHVTESHRAVSVFFPKEKKARKRS